MNRYLIDTNVISETSRAKPDKGALEWLKHTRGEQQFVSTLTRAKIIRGMKKTKADPPHHRKLLQWHTETLVPYFAGRIVPFDEISAAHWGESIGPLKKTFPVIDGLIAATALAYGMVLV